MIVDLMRKDIAHIARTGTGRVPALLTVERCHRAAADL